MDLSLLPMEEPGNIVLRWWRTTLRPLHSWRSLWVETYRGDSLGAPLGFAYLWILATTPLVALAAKLGWDAIRSSMGPYVGMSLANSVQMVPATMAAFLLRPLVVMLLGGIAAHGVMWILEGEARGRLRGTLRVIGYACAWMVPASAILSSVAVYLQMNPIAALDPKAGFFPDREASLLAKGIAVGAFFLDGATLLLVVWGLWVVHRSRVWKTVIAGVAAWGVSGVALVLLSAVMNLGFVELLMTRHQQTRIQGQTPEKRFKRMVEIVQKSHDKAASALRETGLPEPPRVVDLLTGGNWGIAIDLQQASRNGFIPSCQVVYESTLSALKGQVVHYSACLGEPVSSLVAGGPAPVLPPGAEAFQKQVRIIQNPAQKAGMSKAKNIFIDALVDVQSKIGPFQSSSMGREAQPGAGSPISPLPEPRAASSGGESQPMASPVPGASTLGHPVDRDTDVPLRETPLGALNRKANSRVTTPEVRLLAEQGHSIAMNELGRRLYNGYQNTQRDQAEGARWLESAYQAGFRDQSSCFTLWVAYNNGWGVVANPERSQLWKRRGDEIR